MESRQRILSIICLSFITSACSANSNFTSGTDRNSEVGPISCELEAIESWIHFIAVEKYPNTGDFSKHTVHVEQVSNGWLVYLMPPVTNDGIVRKGGSPTAILEPQTCEVKELYMTQ